MQQQRPLIITIVCIIGFLAFGLSLFAVPALYGTLTATYGAWYGPFWLASLALTLASLIGYWLMKKWGVVLYIGTFVAGTAVGVLLGLPFTLLGLVVPLVVSALGLAYLRRMRWNAGSDPGCVAPQELVSGVWISDCHRAADRLQ